MTSFIGSTGKIVDEPTQEDWQEIASDLTEQKGGRRRRSRSNKRKSRSNKRKSRSNKRKSRRNKRR